MRTLIFTVVLKFSRQEKKFLVNFSINLELDLSFKQLAPDPAPLAFYTELQLRLQRPDCIYKTLKKIQPN